MMPGFFPRLRDSLLAALTLSHPPSPPPTPPSPSSAEPPSLSSLRHAKLARRLSTLRTTPRFAPLVPLARHLAFTNDPTHPTSTAARPKSAGQAPAFAPSLLSWVGGSLAGALKTGGEEILRERWEEAHEVGRGEEGDGEPGETSFVLPDWSRRSMA